MRHALVVLLVSLPALAAAKEAHLDSYGGTGTAEAIVVRGRVARGAASVDKPGRGKLRRVWATARAFLGRDLEHAHLGIRDRALPGMPMVLRADDEGFFEARLPGPHALGPHSVEVTLLEKGWSAAPLVLEVRVVDGARGLVAVTDIDDTILVTGVTGGKIKLIEHIAISDAADLEPIPGAAEALRTFADGGVPIVYVTASPVELGPRLTRFLALRGFPAGAIYLRRYADEGIGDPTAYKRKRIDEVLAAFPGRRLLLFGDNGEKDRDIFAALAAETGRVAFAYIRRTVPDTRALPDQALFSDWAEVVPHARGAGLLK